MAKYILGTDGKLIPADGKASVNPQVASKVHGEEINGNINNRNVLNYVDSAFFPEDTSLVDERVIKLSGDEAIQSLGDFVETKNFRHYLPFNSYSDTGDDENNRYAFANLESKMQLAEGFSGNREIVAEVVEEALQIWVASLITAIAFEAFYAQWKEDVRSKTDLTMGSYRQQASMNILDNFIEILHKEANWPKTKSGAVSALATGLLVDFTNTDIVKVAKEIDLGGAVGSLIGFPTSIITLLLNNLVDGLLNSQDVFNRVKLRLRRITLDSVYKRFVRDQRSTVQTNFGFTDFVNTYYFKYIIERINIGEKLLVKYVLGDHPLGYNVDTRYLPENALTRLMKSKKGVVQDSPFFVPGNQSASPLRLTALPSNLNVGHEIQRAVALNSTNKDDDSDLKNLGALSTKFKIRGREGNQKRFSQSEVEKLENYLEAEYVPFYFQDLRNNEIMAFHAFVESISDSFNPSFNESDGYGRVESVKTYSKTTRNISINFTLAAMNPDDHDYMWFCVNRLVAMCYPQWSKGSKLDGGFTQPFSQIPTASPVVRIRLGDLFKSNYSRKNLSRLFGAGDEDFSIKKDDSNKDQFEKYSADGEGIKEADSKFYVVTKGNPPPGILKTNSKEATIKKSLGETDFFRKGSGVALGLPFTDLTEGDHVHLLPGIYPENTHGVTQFLGTVGIKATLPFTRDGDFGRTYFKNNTYLKCKVKEYSESTSIVSFLGGPSDEGKSHVGFYILEPVNMKDREILASHDSITLLSEDTSAGGNFQVDKIKSGFGLMDAFMKPDNIDPTKKATADLKIFNPIVKAFESSRGRGLAGVITQLDYNYNDSTWETSRIGSKAPQFMRVQLTFSPIHDIPLGLDHNGFMRAPAYPVGKVNKTFFGDTYDKAGKDGLESAIAFYESLQDNLNDFK